ncbi:MAG: hypothetical protein HC905_03305 [Bacteroidales bacterium]|nr:hypothetical protein [Bacteroidales bacterium]
MIRTISHEFNNSIGPINSILESLKTHIIKSASDNQADFENAITVAVDRNNALNEFIKRYASIFKLPVPIKEKCNIMNCCSGLIKFFTILLKTKGYKS